MILKNSNKELKNLLKKEHDNYVYSIKSDAEKKRELLLKEYKQEAKKEASLLYEESLKEKKRELQVLLELKKQESFQLLSHKKDVLFEELIATLLVKINDLPKKELKPILKYMLEDMKFKVSKKHKDLEFKFHTFKDIKFKGVESNLEFLGVLAESDIIDYENSVDSLIEKNKLKFYQKMKELIKI